MSHSEWIGFKRVFPELNRCPDCQKKTNLVHVGIAGYRESIGVQFEGYCKKCEQDFIVTVNMDAVKNHFEISITVSSQIMEEKTHNKVKDNFSESV